MRRYTSDNCVSPLYQHVLGGGAASGDLPGGGAASGDVPGGGTASGDVSLHLQSAPLVSTADNCVSPLYQHVFPPHLAPSLSFIGLPWWGGAI